MSVNLCNFMGNVVRDPEIRLTKDGKKIAKFSIAMNRHYRDGQQEKQRETSYADCECFGNKAEFAEKHLKGGEPIHVTARLRNDKWVDKEEKTHHRVMFVVENFSFVPKSPRQ